jgi:hypothetical protein
LDIRINNLYIHVWIIELKIFAYHIFFKETWMSLPGLGYPNPQERPAIATKKHSKGMAEIS